MTAPGYNPMRHDCERDGCFNRTRRPKLEIFAECFPGRINFGDVDGRVEINWRFLELEWKESPRQLPTGQRIALERLTATCPVSVLVVAGDAETMAVTHYGVFHNGTFRAWVPGDIEDVKGKCRSWAAWAQREWNGAHG